MDKLTQFRKDKDVLFNNDPQSPLTREQKQNFKGLNYFSPNSNLIFHRLKIEPAAAEQIVQVNTSAGDTQPFKKLGKIHFEVGDTPCELTVYDSTDAAGIFLPFKDRTNGGDTYHDGRYVEVEVENGTIKELDFNYAYNPYCAYNGNFRCPITPEENNLTVEIQAGEKRFR
ncbi:MAG: DUF1684 domain-containing protein [bacterium]|nr:DUF1684 domain-containing protein [bacterium]